ncbi:rod shape-determining protein MreD [Clostridium aminobutyricum]|uniref:Rod shape-determining protein MreD n=1 Tax=Clostridium aminobutyricum TaxID=33953 RepID=A0A939D7X3_CLOAM|nr:rod shape-determining protein MreD [Clostridium aminobutyricum]MBN7772771.1 rod shape-determining protein MreD [Clostridium aminobutyricum]
MKIRYAVLLFLLAFLFQGTLLNLFAIKGATPNLILCLVSIFSFLYEDNKGIVMGVVFGLLSDLCMGQYLGIAAMGYLIIGLTVSFMREMINKENIASIIIVTICSTIGYNLIYYVISVFFFGSIYSFIYWMKIQPLYIIENIIVVLILYINLMKTIVKYRNDRYLIWKKY